MILLLDNYDSFVFNLARYLQELGAETHVVRSDSLSVSDIERLQPHAVVISPGPCTPLEAGISMEVIRELGPAIPMLGVCLGHQAIGHAFGAEIVRAERLMHGKTDLIYHDSTGLFAGLDNPFQATRYHSLVIRPGTLPDCLEVCAWADAPAGGREIMGVRHRELPIFGVQFHPESFLTDCGVLILEQFLKQSAPQVR